MANTKSNKAVIKLVYDDGVHHYDKIIAKFDHLGDAVIAANALNEANVSSKDKLLFIASLANKVTRFA
jgi:hypothetical protein